MRVVLTSSARQLSNYWTHVRVHMKFVISVSIKSWKEICSGECGSIIDPKHAADISEHNSKCPVWIDLSSDWGKSKSKRLTGTYRSSHNRIQFLVLSYVISMKTIMTMAREVHLLSSTQAGWVFKQLHMEFKVKCTCGAEKVQSLVH